ncbi:MAG: MOSC domain-containing protein [Actinomycetota bacterium]|nr:MOSC domain-containing protein [Actinomycetota bacterium]
MQPLTASELMDGLDHILAAPPDVGTVELIAVRPSVDARRVVDEAVLDPQLGVVGDRWRQQSRNGDPANQVTLMNARCADLVAQARDRWSLAGDQLYVDFDLSVVNLPAGSRLRVGTALIEISTRPHTGCSKFANRFGADALRFVNGEVGAPLRLRGVNASIVEAGRVSTGDKVEKV